MLVIDNFLTEKDFDIVSSSLINLDYKFFPRANFNSSSEHHFHFTHTYIDRWRCQYDNADYIPKIIMNTYCKRYKKNIELIKARSNLFVKTFNAPIGMGYHQDIYDAIENKVSPHTLLIYMEDSNGQTGFKDGTNVMSKSNRAVVFHNDDFHQTITSTDTLFRRNININFVED